MGIKKHFKFFVAVFSVIALILPFFSAIPVNAEEIISMQFKGINIQRKSAYLVAYTDDYESNTTKTDDEGIEAIVNEKGIVTEIGGNNNSIPKGGFVLSGSNNKKRFIEDNIKIGYGVYLDKQNSTVTIFPDDYNPFYSSTIEYTSVNTTRYEDTLVIYDGKDGKTASGTNQWGYEAVVNADGYIISVGGNNNDIPDGGYVLSAIGTKKPILTEAAKVGMAVDIDDNSKIVSISHNKKSAVEAPNLIIEQWKTDIEQAKSLYKNLDYDKINNAAQKLENEYENIKALIEKDEITAYLVAQNKFNSLSDGLKNLLIETPAVEGRALWIRPTQKNAENVKKVVKEIYEMGFNIICIEGLYNNTMIMPMPEGSLLSQNPSFDGFDILSAYIEECHKYGMEIHLWMPVFRVAHGGSSYPDLGLNKIKPEWLNISNTGINYVENQYGKGYYLNPALPEVQDYLLSVYKYILENYSLDSFQLDYIRYPDLVKGVDYGYDDYTCGLFKEKYNIDPKEIIMSGKNWDTWCKFRAEFVTEFILKIKALVDEKRPDIYLCCDVAPSYEESLNKMKQDTKAWIQEPYLDIVYPMAYGTVDTVKSCTEATVALAGDKVFTYMGIGDYGAEALFDQIIATRENGADGMAFFAYAQFIQGDYASIPKTIFADRAVSPTLNGKKAVISQLKFTKNRVKNIIVPAEISGSSELDDLCENIDTLITNIDESSLAACKGDIEKLVSDINTVLQDKVTDENAVNTVENDLILVSKITSLSKDEEKSAYYIDHPLPDLYNVAKNDNNNVEEDNNSSDEDVPTNTLTPFEKVARGVSIGIISFSVLALPFYFILDNRRKKMIEESKNKNNNENSDNTSDKQNDTENKE